MTRKTIRWFPEETVEKLKIVNSWKNHPLIGTIIRSIDISKMQTISIDQGEREKTSVTLIRTMAKDVRLIIQNNSHKASHNFNPSSVIQGAYLSKKVISSTNNQMRKNINDSKMAVEIDSCKWLHRPTQNPSLISIIIKNKIIKTSSSRNRKFNARPTSAKKKITQMKMMTRMK